MITNWKKTIAQHKKKMVMKRFKTSYQIQKGKGINRKMQINEKLRRKSQLQMRIGDDLFISQVGPTKTPTGKKKITLSSRKKSI